VGVGGGSGGEALQRGRRRRHAVGCAGRLAQTQARRGRRRRFSGMRQRHLTARHNSVVSKKK
jgi:hypothetical protein